MADLALKTLAPGVHYLPGVVNVGVLETPDGQALLVDSGADRDHAKRLVKACRAAGLEPAAALNTHSHADHIGGNAHLQASLGLPLHAPIFEEAFLSHPILEPIGLYCGARPPKGMQGKGLLASPSGAKVLNEPGLTRLAGLEVELIETSGHAHMQYAVAVGGVLFAADALFGPGVLDKHPLPFGVDIERQREAASRLGARLDAVVLPGHGEPTADLAGLVAANLAALERASRAVLAACSPGGTLSEVVARTCDSLGLEMTDIARYHLNQTTVLAHLTELYERGAVGYELRANRLVWSALEPGTAHRA